MQIRLATTGQGWDSRGSVATLGNLDGVHRGHQAILAQARHKADSLGVASIAVVFEPQPREFFAPNDAPARLTRLKEKCHALAGLVDGVQVLRFNGALAAQQPEAFVEHWLVRELGVKHLVVGDDFRFGARRAGDYSLLQRMGVDAGFDVERTREVLHKGRRISSTWVRQALGANDLALAESLLGRPYQMLGRVGYGMQLARTLGSPTANLRINRKVSPLKGVFAVRVDAPSAGLVDVAGVANLGSRPSIPDRDMALEVHLFDVDADLYGHELRVRFIHALRPEQTFAGLDALKHQIHLDHQAARAALAHPTDTL